MHIFGRVQGVFFRQSAKIRADELGITGWARNAADGSVEIIAEGDKEALERFLYWTRKGSELAEVKRVEEEWSQETGEFRSFEVQ
jgi:acylphosphatase